MKKLSLFLTFFMLVGLTQAQRFYEGWETYNHNVGLSKWQVIHKHAMRSSCAPSASGWVINVIGSKIMNTVISTPTNGDTNKNLMTFACGGAPNKGTDSWLISPKIKKVKEGDYLSFYLVNFTGSENNNLQVLISTTDSAIESFTPIDSFPEYRTETWTLYSYSMADYVGKDIYIAFRAYFFPEKMLEFGAVLGLDLVKIGSVDEYDLAILEMTSPEIPMQNVDTAVPITMVVKNQGHDVTSFDVWYLQSSKIENWKSPYSYAEHVKVNKELKTLDTMHVTFPKYTKFIKGSRDTLFAWVDVPNDLDHTNDTLARTLVDNVSPAGIPYVNSFDSAHDVSGMRVFNIFRDESTWKHVATPMYAHKGDGCMEYSGNSKYAANDWFFTKLIYFNAKEYEVTYWYGTSDAEKPQKLTVAWAYKQKYQALMWELSWKDNIVNQVASDKTDLDRSYLQGKARFKVEEAGFYYIGFHATSPASEAKLYIDDLVVTRAVDVKESAEDYSVNIFPNPVRDMLTVEADAAINSVEIYNTLGQKVYSNKVSDNRVEVNTQSFASGLYIIKTNTERGFSTKKVNVVR